MTMPAGWYDDGQGSQRWWDGSTWTAHTQPTQQDAPPAAQPAWQPQAQPAWQPQTQPASPPAAGWQQQPTAWQTPPGASARGRSRRGLVIGLIVGAVLLLGVGGGVVAWLVTRATSGPGEAVTSFHDAWFSQDCEGVQRVTTQEFQDLTWPGGCSDIEQYSGNLIADLEGGVDGFSWNQDSVTVSGATATVVGTEAFEYIEDGRTEWETTFGLEKVDGDWRISSIASE